SVSRPSSSSWWTMASPSDVSWMSHSMAKLPAIAARAAAGMFSIMPRVASCRPRWATGRTVSQAGALNSGDLEQAFDLDSRIRRKGCDTNRCGGGASPVAERGAHQVGCAVQHLRSIQKIRSRIDEAAEPNHAYHLVEVPECSLHLREQVDAAAARRRGTLLNRNAGP